MRGPARQKYPAHRPPRRASSGALNEYESGCCWSVLYRIEPSNTKPGVHHYVGCQPLRSCGPQISQSRHTDKGPPCTWTVGQLAAAQTTPCWKQPAPTTGRWGPPGKVGIYRKDAILDTVSRSVYRITDFVPISRYPNSFNNSRHVGCAVRASLARTPSLAHCNGHQMTPTVRYQLLASALHPTSGTTTTATDIG